MPRIDGGDHAPVHGGDPQQSPSGRAEHLAETAPPDQRPVGQGGVVLRKAAQLQDFQVLRQNGMVQQPGGQAQEEPVNRQGQKQQAHGGARRQQTQENAREEPSARRSADERRKDQQPQRQGHAQDPRAAVAQTQAEPAQHRARPIEGPLAPGGLQQPEDREQQQRRRGKAQIVGVAQSRQPAPEKTAPNHVVGRRVRQQGETCGDQSRQLQSGKTGHGKTGEAFRQPFPVRIGESRAVHRRQQAPDAQELGQKKPQRQAVGVQAGYPGEEGKAQQQQEVSPPQQPAAKQHPKQRAESGNGADRV